MGLYPKGIGGSDQNRPKWHRFSPALTSRVTLRDCEGLGEAIREARTSAFNAVRTAPAGTSDVELVVLVHCC